MKNDKFEKEFKRILIRDNFVIVHTKYFDFLANNYYIIKDNVWLYYIHGGIVLILKMKAIKGMY